MTSPAVGTRNVPNDSWNLQELPKTSNDYIPMTTFRVTDRREAIVDGIVEQTSERLAPNEGAAVDRRMASSINPPPPACQGSSSVLDSDHLLPYGNLPDQEHLPAALRIPSCRSPLGGNFCSKIASKINAIPSCLLMPSGSDFGWSWQPQGSKMEAKVEPNPSPKWCRQAVPEADLVFNQFS